jgi:hypothetical protein
VLAVDVAFARNLTVPEAVLHEAEAAATALLRLTPFPFGDPVWKDFHMRFLDRYGCGAVVGVRDVVADSGLGYPAGFLGAPRPRAAHLLTERDVTLLALIQQAAVEGRTEITLTEQIIGDLRVGDHTKMVTPTRVELAFQVHTSSLDALERGQFQLWLTGAPMHANSMVGRFAHLLPDEDQQRLAATYTPTRERTIAAQLSFPPRREQNENITRVPRLLPHVIPLAEYRADDETVIWLDDLASPPIPRRYPWCESQPGNVFSRTSCTPWKPLRRPRPWRGFSPRWRPRGAEPSAPLDSALPTTCRSTPASAMAASCCPQLGGC